VAVEVIMDSIRQNVRGVLELFASRGAQREYQCTVPCISVPVELFCLWADDQYHPEAPPFQQSFSGPEREALADFHRAFERAAATLLIVPPDLDSFWATPQASDLARAAVHALARLTRDGETPG